MLSVGDTKVGLLGSQFISPLFICDAAGTHRLFPILFPSNAFAPMPGAWLAMLPNGAWGITTLAASDGLCSGWMGVALGESLGVDVDDIVVL